MYLKNLPRPRVSWCSAASYGFTLIEGIIATGIISTALIVGLTLAYSNLLAAQANSDRIIAGHLAREGLEVVRNIRDSNWLRRDFNVDKDTTKDELQFYNWDDFFNNWPYDDETPLENYYDVRLLDPVPSAQYPYRLAVPSNTGYPFDVVSCIANKDTACQVQRKGNTYFQDRTLHAGAEVTPFYRRILLKPICLSSPSNTTYVVETTTSMDCNPVWAKIGVLVTSHVMWQRGDKTLEVRLKERLYNWRS